MNNIFLIPIYLAAATAAANPAVWTREPEAALGIKLGVPLAESAVPACPESSFERPKALCIDRPMISDDVFSIRGLPFDDIAADGLVETFQGRVRKVSLIFNHVSYDRMRAILVEKYGNPSSSQNDTVKTLSGLSVSAETATWTGKRNIISARERIGQVDQSIVSFDSIELDGLWYQAQQDKIKTDAGKL